MLWIWLHNYTDFFKINNLSVFFSLEMTFLEEFNP